MNNKISEFNSLADFTAIDFETAHGKSWSVCQVGLVVVKNGEIVQEYESLIQPPDNYYYWTHVRVHGINKKKTLFSPSFDKVWTEIESFITNKNIVAHNAVFDVACLQDSLKYYNLPVPDFRSHCTLKIYKRNLAAVCEKYNIPLNHHDALSDARACALLFLKHLKEGINS